MPAPGLFLKLLVAHLAGDFFFQSASLAQGKHRPALLTLHLSVHAALLGLVGWSEPPRAGLWPALFLVFVSHGVIDAWTSRVERRNFSLFAFDQAAHVAVMLIAVVIAAGDFQVEPWRTMVQAIHRHDAWLSVCGGLIAVPAGAIAIGRWVRPFRDALSHESQHQRTGLELAGRWIGMLERLIVYVAMLARIEPLIAVVVAIKALLRLPEAREKWSRELAEYYLVGSLASLAWALLTGLAVRQLLAAN